MSPVSPFWMAATACAALFLVILDNTIVNVAIVPIARALSADVHAVQWVVGAYFLAQATVLPVTGYLAIRFGTKRVFLLAFALFVLASGLCGTAQSAFQLIGFRVLQGLGGGALYPLAQSIAFGAYTGPDRIKGVSLTMIPGVLAPTLGPISGGLLTLHYGWPSIFLINVPLGLFFLIVAARLLPPGAEKRTPHGFDVSGLLLCSVGVVALTYGFSLVGTPVGGTVDELHPRGRPHGWGSPLTTASLALGLMTLVVFVRHELRRADPVLELRLFLRRRFAAASAIACVNNAIFFGSMLLLPFFLIHVRSPSMTSLEVGYLVAPQGLGSAFMLLVSLRLGRTWGVAPLVALGSVLLGVSSWGIARAASALGSLSFVPWIFIRGMGFGTVFQLTQSMAVDGISPGELPQTTSLFNVVRQISSSIGLALMLSVFADWSASHAHLIREASGQLLDRGVIERAGVSAFRDLFYGLAALSSVSAILSIVLLRPSHIDGDVAPVPPVIVRPGALS